MSQSVDDMSQNEKIVTNRPSTKQIYDISSRTNGTCDKSSVTYVTNNLCPNQSMICLKMERYALFK